MRGRRRIVLAVVAVAVAVGGYAGGMGIGRRAKRFRQLADFHARRRTMFHDGIASKERAARGCEEYGGERMLRIAREYRAEAKLCVKFAAYHARLRRKYEHAAAHPWLPVDADPPEPGP